MSNPPPYNLPSSAVFSLGRKVGFLGDSIVSGTGASNSIYAFAPQALEMLGSAAVKSIATGGSVSSGHPGYTSAQISPYLQTDIMAAGCTTLVTLQGTNDVGQGISLSVYAANMLAQFKAAKAAGIRLFVMTIPPRGSNVSPTNAQMTAIDVFNTWLRLAVPLYGTLIDIHSLLIQASAGTNYYAGAYDSGDGIHPNNAGHRVIAVAIAQAFRASGLILPSILDCQSAQSFLANGLFFSSTSGWFEQPGGTGTAATYSVVADTSGFLTAGQFGQMDLPQGSTSGSRVFAKGFGTLGTDYSAGDTLALCAKVQINDVSGNWTAMGPGSPAGTTGFKIGVTDQTGAFIAGSPVLTTGSAIPAGMDCIITARVSRRSSFPPPPRASCFGCSSAQPPRHMYRPGSAR